MKYYLKLGLVLMIISAIASGILAYLNSLTYPIIVENQKKAENQARKTVLPEAETFEKIESDFLYYKGLNTNGEVVGYTFIAGLYGYSSEVRTMVGVGLDMKVKNIKILSQTETPGLGANCDKPDFPNRFKGKDINSLAVDKDGGKISSITGATITTRAVTNSIKIGLESLQKSNKEI